MLRLLKPRHKPDFGLPMPDIGKQQTLRASDVLQVGKVRYSRADRPARAVRLLGLQN
jgi:hypothetical protein